jgi:HK97 family phage major capsid protein
VDSKAQLGIFYRAVTIHPVDPAYPGDAIPGVKESDTRIPISISSESPVTRQGWNGSFVEVLGHKPSEVDMGRAKTGLPLVMEHDLSNPANHIGVVEDITLKDGELRGMARPSERPDAQAIFSDMRSGIRPNISVGYRTKELTQVGKGDPKTNTPPTYRATKWAPHEVSSVAAGEDYTVGVGRAIHEDALPVVIRSLATVDAIAPQQESIQVPEAVITPVVVPATPAVPAVVVGPDLAVENTRGLAALATTHGRQNDLPSWITAGRSVKDISDEIMAAYAKRAAGPAVDSTAAAIGVSAKEMSKYSISRAILNHSDGKRGFETEVSDALQKHLGGAIPQHGGFYAPSGGDPGSKRAVDMQRAIDAHTSTAATELVFTEYGNDFIELLRNASVVVAAGAKVLSGLTSNIAFPKQTGAATAYWVGDNTSTVSESNLTTGLITMSPKQLQASTQYSRMLLQQSVVGVDALVRQDLTLVHALAIDLAALLGTGSTNQPKGLVSITSVQALTVAADSGQGGLPTWADVVNMEKAVANSNASVGPLAYVTNPTVRSRLKQTAKLSNTIAMPIWEGPYGQVGSMQVGEMNGYPAYATKQVSSALTVGTTTGNSYLFFGAWDQLIIGHWGIMELIADPLTLARQGLIQVTSFELVDINVRHPESFAFYADVLP